jgi:type II secretory pathway component PulK
MSAAPVPRRGFALLAVLWVMVSAAALGLTLSLAGREAVATARNRTAAARAMWRAEGCLERSRAAIADAIAGPTLYQRVEGFVWLRLDSVVMSSSLMATARCNVSLRAAGTSLDVNEADEEMLHELLVAAGIDRARADSMVAALLDWRDADGLPRPLGAEHEWYLGAGRSPPRNAPLADRRELRLVRGFETASVVDSLLGVDRGRIPLAIAPVPVIAALPGIGAEALARIAERRLYAAWPVDPLTLGAALSQPARDAMLATFAELSRWTNTEPDAWVLTSRAGDGASPVSVAIEIRLVRAGTRAAIVRRRSWME